MKRTITIAGLVFVCSISAFGQTAERTSDKGAKAKEQVMALANEYANAFVKGDGATMERIVSDDYGDIGLAGSKFLLTRAFKEGGVLPAVFRLGENPTFRYFGNAAVLITDATLKWPESDKLGWNSRYMITFVAAIENGRWRIATIHMSVGEKTTPFKLVEASTGQSIAGTYVIIERIAYVKYAKCPTTPCPPFRKVIFSGNSDARGGISVSPVVFEPKDTIRVEYEITADGYGKQPLRIEKDVIKLSRRTTGN